MAPGTRGVRGWERDVTYRPESAVVDRREGETPTGGMAGTTALSSRSRMNSNKDRREGWRSGHAHSGGVVVAAHATTNRARDSRRLMVDKPTDERRRVVAVAAIGSQRRGDMRRGLTDGTESIVTRLTRDGVPRQDTVIENTAQVVRGGAVANVTGFSDVARQRVRMRRRILAGNRHTIRLHAQAIVAARLTAGARYDDLGIGVIQKRGLEGRRRVTGIAFHRNTWMPRGTGIGIGANRDSAIVTGRTDSSDTRVIERSVRIELQEMVSRVAIATFLRGNEVTRRFPDGDNAIMATATRPEYFGVIDEARGVEA